MQQTIFEYISDDYKPSYNINNYVVKRVDCKTAKEYICKNHYSHGCHNAPSPCYALYDNGNMIGCLMFATPCSENVRASLFGKEYVDNVIELHRLHILDITPKNTESWFISRCLKLLLIDRPQTWGVISFSDTTEGHEGTIYKATNFIQCGRGGKHTFYLDDNGRLHHPRQNGVNISIDEALKRGWKPVKRDEKNRYIKILGINKKELKKHISMFEINNKRKLKQKEKSYERN